MDGQNKMVGGQNFGKGDRRSSEKSGRGPLGGPKFAEIVGGSSRVVGVKICENCRRHRKW